MSVKYLTLAFDSRVENPLRKLVLIKLCDNANDEGECWPSFQHIANQCEISRRSVITHIKWLIDNNFILSESRFKNSEQTTNVYKISKDKLIGSAAPALPSEPIALPPVQELHPPSAGAAPRTVIESSNLTVIESLLNNFDYSSWPSLPEDQTMIDWHSMRKSKKAKISQTVINQFGKELKLAIEHGFTVDQCLSECVTRNWTGFNFEWLLRGNGNAANQQFVGSGRGKEKVSLADRTREEARLAIERIDAQTGNPVIHAPDRPIREQGGFSRDSDLF